MTKRVIEGVILTLMGLPLAYRAIEGVFFQKMSVAPVHSSSLSLSGPVAVAYGAGCGFLVVALVVAFIGANKAETKKKWYSWSITSALVGTLLMLSAFV